MATPRRVGLWRPRGSRFTTEGAELDIQSANGAAIEERVASLAEVVNQLVGVVSRLDDETSDTAAAAFNSDVPRVAGHKATAEELKRLSHTLDAWLKEWSTGNRG
jgi:hypothetical protein